MGQGDPAEWSDPVVGRTTEAMLRTLIGTLRNHPSVVIWGVGNECGTDREEARPLIARLVKTARSMDGTRPIAYVGFLGTRERVYDLVDLPCHNQYFGLRLDELGRHLDAVHALAPDKPLLATEFGHEAIRGIRGEGYGTEDEQAAVLESNWRAIRDRSDYMPGGLIWCLADYWHMPCGPDHDWMGRSYFCHGVVTLDRRPKKACQAVRRMWRRPGRAECPREI
jgi:beta-glucuronidase